MEYLHNHHWDSYNPILISKVTNNKNGTRTVEGVIKVNGNILQEGDIISSQYIGRDIFINRFLVKEIIERKDAIGNYKGDVSKAFFIAIVEPISNNIVK